MHQYEDSICYYFFEKKRYINDFLDKYRHFKIYDDKGRVYPLHITRALHQGCALEAEDIAELSAQKQGE
jgi:hypothetical protein